MKRYPDFVKRTVLQSTLREWQALLLRPRLWATFAIVVLVFAFTGPFSTISSMTFAERFTYWLVVHGLAWSIAIFMALGSDTLLEHRIRSLFARLAIGSMLAAVPIGGMLVLVDLAFSGGPATLAHFFMQVAVSLPLCALFCMLTYLTLSQQIAEADLEPSNAREPVSIPLLRRLKPENRGRLIRLSAGDHYTEVVTTGGKELLLIRFADALSELAGYDGLQVHRSHWVAADQVLDRTRDGGRIVLRMSDGSDIPVSRSCQAAFRARFTD